MLNAGYAFITAYLKGEEARILNTGHINALLRASRPQDVLGAIRDTDIGDYLNGFAINTFDEADRYLWSYLNGCFSKICWFTGVPSDVTRFVGEYLTKFDVTNIKSTLQALDREEAASLIPIGEVNNAGKLDEMIGAADAEAVAALLGNCGLHHFAAIVREYDPEEGEKSRMMTGVKLDGDFYSRLMETARRMMDGKAITSILGAFIDLKNLQIVMRAVIGGMDAEVAEFGLRGGTSISRDDISEMITLKINEIPGRLSGTPYQQMVEEILGNYDKNKDISVIDEIIERHKFNISRETLSLALMSPMVAVWYLFTKEAEVRNLRLVFKAVFDSIPVEEIRNNLVMAQ